MRTRQAVWYSLLGGSGLLFAVTLLAQNTADRTLIVNGKPQGNVIQMDGRSYVDVETVAQFINGSVTLEPNRVVLTFPATGTSAAPAQNAQAPASPPQGLSRNFASLAISELAEMREWRGAIGTILMYGVPVVGTWPQDYHDRAQTDLDQVAVSATTAADENALQLLRNEFSNLTQWASEVVGTRQSLDATNSVRPGALQNDPALTKISDCNRFLSSMLVSGSFADNPSCH